jgi:cell division septum initiation protein DivIVA
MFENLQLKKRIEDLEQQLKDAEMKAIAFSTMVDIAEKEFNISIKKYNTKS